MSDTFNFEQQLKSLVPRASAIGRDELLYRAGYEAALATVSGGSLQRLAPDTLQQTKKLWPRRFAIAASILLALCLGAIIGRQFGNEGEWARQVIAKKNVKQAPIASQTYSDTVSTAEPSAENFSLTSFNKPNYIELRDRVLVIGMNAMPGNDMLPGNSVLSGNELVGTAGLSDARSQVREAESTLTPFSYSEFERSELKSRSSLRN